MEEKKKMGTTRSLKERRVECEEGGEGKRRRDRKIYMEGNKYSKSASAAVMEGEQLH